LFFFVVGWFALSLESLLAFRFLNLVIVLESWRYYRAPLSTEYLGDMIDALLILDSGVVVDNPMLLWMTQTLILAADFSGFLGFPFLLL